MISDNKKIIITKEDLTLLEIRKVAFEGYLVGFSEDCKNAVDKSRAFLEERIKSGKTIYGINTGFGFLADVVISPDKLEQLQENLIKSHATGVGEPLSEPIVRILMLLRINVLARGFSGVRFELLEKLAEFLNAGIHPYIPSQGSVGASGDLAPLAHLALTLIGEGYCYIDSKKIATEKILGQKKIKPIRLAAKEGLAMINGTQAMTAIGIDVILKSKLLVKYADVIAAASLDAMKGTLAAFDYDIQRIRPHKGQMQVAKNFHKLLKKDEIMKSHKDCGKVQDPYSIRCIPQVHGAVRDTLHHVKQVLETEVNSVTDNPLVFPDGDKILSGGNFHGEPVAFVMDFLAIALAELGCISERRIDKLLAPAFSGLPAFLIKDGGLNSGFMIPQVVAASLVSENKILAHPASVDSIPTSMDKEDHVSMGTIAARKADSILKNVTNVLAIELIMACQGLDFMTKLKPGCGVTILRDAIRKEIPFIEQDVFLHPLIEKGADFLKSSALLEVIESAIGTLQ